LQRSGTKLFGTIAMTFDQNDRNIRGTWLFTSGAGTGGPGFNDWHGEITGTLTLDSNGTTRFNGTATIIAEIVGGTGACHGSSLMEGVISDTSIRLEGPNVVYRDCISGTGGLVWILSRDASNPSPPSPSPPPTPTPTPTPPGQLSCTATVSGSEPAAATLLTFDEPEIEATRTLTESSGTYASCPNRYSDTISQFSVKGLTLQGRYSFRSLWRGCTSSNPAVWEAGVLQTRDSVLTIGVNSVPRPTSMRFSLGVDGSSPSPQFTLTVTDATGATANTTVTTLLGRATMSCTNPIASVRVSHDGPAWIMDSLAF
jgi:hypothetical protein